MWTVPPVQPNGQHHISNLGIEEMFFSSRNRYLGLLGIDEMWNGGVVPMVRQLTTRFDAEASSGDSLVVISNVVSRSSRAFVMEQRLTREGEIVATCQSVHVCVDRQVGGATGIPDDLWIAIVEVEQGDLALTDFQPNG